MELISLASASPRRAQLLEQLGLPFRTVLQDTEEVFNQKSAAHNAARIAEEKIKACQNSHPDSQWIIGADTFICFKGKMTGKPADREEARSMIAGFSGKTHKVITGVSVYSAKSSKTLCSCASTSVIFRKLGRDEIEWYLDSGEWQGAAGSYRIQEKGAVLVRKIIGSYSNVMGLPIQLIYVMLRELGYGFTAV